MLVKNGKSLFAPLLATTVLVGLAVWVLWGIRVLSTDRGAPRPPATRESQDLLIFAPSSLMDVLPDLARMWTESSGVKVVFQFGATPQLARQIREGAVADVLLSAHPSWTEELTQKGFLLPPTVRRIATNRLVLAAAVNPKSPVNSSFQSSLHSPIKNLSIDDLKGSPFLDSITKLALAGEGVPAAVYAEQALQKIGLWLPLKDRVVRGDSVRSVVHWLKTGAVPFGVVYKTDLKDTGLDLVFEFPTELHEPIVYTGAVVKAGTHPKYGTAFLDFMLSHPAQKKFEQVGYGSPTSQRLSSKR